MDNVGVFYDSRGASKINDVPKVYGAESFSLHLRAPYSFAQKQVAQVIPSKGVKVVDFCCGTGVHSVALAKSGAQVIAVDLSEKSIEAAKALAQFHEVSCDFKVGDALDFLKTISDVDCLYCSGSMYYFDHKKLVLDIYQTLNNKGIFICVETNGSNILLNIYRRLKSFLKKNRDQRTLNNLVKVNEVHDWANVFESREVYYFGLLSPLSKLFAWSKGLQFFICQVLDKVDFILLNQCGLKFFAFKFVFIGKKNL